jgi:hypothetical protein
MNRKQIICMWLGIAAFVLVGLEVTQWTSPTIFHWESSEDALGSGGRGNLMLPGFIIHWLCIIVVTSGLIYTFRDKKRPETEHPINITCGLTRLTLGLSLLSILFFFTIGICLLLDSDQGAPELFAVGLAVAAGVWVIYALMRWIVVPFVCWVVKGFHQDTG